MRGMKFVFAGGGTGGHLFPAIAVAQSIARLVPGADIHFFGRADKLEAAHVPKYGFTFHAIKAAGFIRGSVVKNISVALSLLSGTLKAIHHFMKLKPAATIITGAYVSAPAAIAARVMGSKLYIVETNSYPGLAVRLFDTSAEAVFTAFDETKKYLRKKENVILAGNPVRGTFYRTEPGIAKSELGFEPSKPLLFVSGGSLGAAAINAAIGNNLAALRGMGVQCLWQCGERYYDTFRYAQSSDIQVRGFIERMDLAMSAADLMISRAGASTLAEIIQNGVPAILVPSPNVTENHQYYNAKSLSDRGAALLATDEELAERLPRFVAELIQGSEKRDMMRARLAEMYAPDSAEKIARAICVSAGIKVEAV